MFEDEAFTEVAVKAFFDALVDFPNLVIGYEF